MAVYYALCRTSFDLLQQEAWKNTTEHQNDQDQTVKASFPCSFADTHHQRAAETAAAARKLRREIFFIFKHSSLCAYRLHLSAAMRFIEKSESVFSIGCTI